MTVNIGDTGYSLLNVVGAAIHKIVNARTFIIASPFKGTAKSGRVVAPALMRADWAAFLQGWQAGMASVDPSLRAGVYVDESEYQSFGFGSLNIPVFIAIAWVPSLGSPQPITHSGNVLGYVEWGNECVKADFQQQLHMLVTSPWNGLYNTVQLNPGLYCRPGSP
jgi:hypothetical protein